MAFSIEVKRNKKENLNTIVFFNVSLEFKIRNNRHIY